MTREQKMENLRQMHATAIKNAKEYGPSKKDLKGVCALFIEQATSIAWAIKALEAAE